MVNSSGCRSYHNAVIFSTLLAAVPLAAVSGDYSTLSSSDVENIFLNPDEIAQPDVSFAEVGDVPISSSQYKREAYQARQRLAMPILKPGEYGTDKDNENNRNTHVADNDMDVYLFNTSSIAPIEYNITMPTGSAGKSGTLRMDVCDIDAADGEVDKVYLNNVLVGTLNGKSDTWGVNIFTIAPGILLDGRNLVRVDIDTKNPGKGVWALTIDWGIIAVAANINSTEISRCWVSPPIQKQGNYVNFFAELTGTVSAVKVYIAGRTIGLTDPDGDKVWSAQWLIPTGLADMTYPVPFYMVAIKAGKVVSLCPTLKVTQ